MNSLKSAKSITIRSSSEPSNHVCARFLRRLRLLIENRYEGIEFEATCRDGSTLKTSRIEEILDFENPSFRRMDRLSIRFGNHLEGGSITVGDLWLFDTCDFSVWGTNDLAVVAFADEVEKRLSELRPWFFPFARTTFTLCLAIVGLALLCAANLLFLFQFGRLPQDNNSTTAVIAAFLPLIALLVLLFHYGDMVWRWLFPRVFFRIGQQVDEYERIGTARKWLLGSGSLGLLGFVGKILPAAFS